MTISRNVLGSKTGGTRLIMLLLARRLHLQLRQLLAKVIPSFFVSCGSWLTKQTCNHYAIIGEEEEIGSKAFTWSRARTFSFNKKSIGKAIVYATATPLNLSVTSTAPPSRRQAGQPMSSAECLMHGAAHALQRAPPRPTPPRPAVNVDVDAPSVVPSAHATCAGAYGEEDVVADGTHAADGVTAAEWPAATLGGVDIRIINAGGPGACTSVVDDGLCPGSAGRGNSNSPSSYLLIVHD